jgi:hypothetical protein
MPKEMNTKKENTSDLWCSVYMCKIISVSKENAAPSCINIEVTYSSLHVFVPDYTKDNIPQHYTALPIPGIKPTFTLCL